MKLFDNNTAYGSSLVWKRGAEIFKYLHIFFIDTYAIGT